MTFLYGLGVDFGSNAYHSGDVAGLGLSSRHAAETGGDKEHAGEIAVFAVAPAGIEHGDSCAVYDTLRADIHV